MLRLGVLYCLLGVVIVIGLLFDCCLCLVVLIVYCSGLVNGLLIVLLLCVCMLMWPIEFRLILICCLLLLLRFVCFALIVLVVCCLIVGFLFCFVCFGLLVANVVELFVVCCSCRLCYLLDFEVWLFLLNSVAVILVFYCICLVWLD